MPIDPKAVSEKTAAKTFPYDWKAVAAYHLGIGAKRDELDLLYEGAKDGMKVVPTFAVVPAFDHVLELLGRAGVDMSMVVHGGQTVRAHRLLPPGGTLTTTGEITGIYDMKRFAQVVVDTRSEQGGELVFETSWSIIVRGAGGFDGPRPPAREEPAVPKDRSPDFTVTETTTPEQALLYRLSGDLNPLHADPAFAAAVGFKEGPILHGLATFGFAARAVIRACAGGDPTRLRAIGGQFRKPVWPGDTIVTQIFSQSPNRFSLIAHVKERPDPVLTAAFAEIA